MLDMVSEKQCGHCGKSVPLKTGFYDNKRGKDGKDKWCTVCKDERSAKNKGIRLALPMSPRAEAMKDCYQQRFRVIRKAGISMVIEGEIPRIDRLLKKHGLLAEDRRP